MNKAYRERANASMATGRRVPLAFVVLSISIVAALLFALVMMIPSGNEEGDDRLLLLIYAVPIAIPFVAFVLDRVERWQSLRRRVVFIDAPVLLLALLRGLVDVPFVSGHSLFLTYALLTVTSRFARITAVFVLVEVTYIKIFIWHDPTLFGGMLLGVVAGLAFRAVPTRSTSAQIARQ